MISIVTNALETARKIRHVISNSPTAAMDVLSDTVKRIQSRLNETPKPVSYPLDWDSDLQRMAFFASNGFGGGIPHTRSGDTTWTMTSPFGNEIDLFAPHPAGAAFGMPSWNWWRSKIHRPNWPDLREILTDELATLPASILERLKVVVGEADSL